MLTLREIVDDPERRAKARELQAELRQRFGPRLNKHPAELQFYYGVDREQMIRNQITALAATRSPVDQEYADHLYNALAEGLSYQGRFREAAALTRSPPHAQEYEEKANAIEALGQQCACPTTMRVPSQRDAKGDEYPARLRVESVFDGRQHLALIRCLTCGGIAALPE